MSRASPPRITPGSVNFRFEETGFETKINPKGVEIAEITFTAHVQAADLQPGRLLRDNGESEVQIRFNRTSDYKSDLMKEKEVQSGFERLYQCLGLIQEIGKPKSKAAMLEALRASTGRHGSGKLIWTCAKKISDDLTEVYSTSPNTKRNEKPIPRGEDGNPVQEITFSNGDTKMVREEIGRLFVPRVKKD